MPSTADFYCDGIKSRMKNYWAAWSPVTRFALGDYGVLNGRCFERIGSLGDFGINVEKQTGTDRSSLEIISDSGVSIIIKLAGEASPAFEAVGTAQAGLRIEFGAQGAFVIHSPETYESFAKDLLALEKEVIRALQNGVWRPEWHVVVRLVSAPSATILISNSARSRLELSARADLSPALSELGRADAGLEVRAQRGDVFKYVGASNVTPFFQLARLRQRLFTQPTFRTRSLRGPHTTPAAAIGPQSDPSSVQLEIVED